MSQNQADDGISLLRHRNARCRIPGLFRRWELGQLLETGRDYHLEDAGVTGDGTALLAIYRAATCISKRKVKTA